jgi:hypothetical protein
MVKWGITQRPGAESLYSGWVQKQDSEQRTVRLELDQKLEASQHSRTFRGILPTLYHHK